MFKRFFQRLRQIGAVAVYNFRQWHKNPRIIITFLLALSLIHISNGIVGPETWGKLDDVLSYDCTVYFSNDGNFQMYKGTGCYYTNFVIRRGTGSGNWAVRTSTGGTSEATNGTYQTFKAY